MKVLTIKEIQEIIKKHNGITNVIKESIKYLKEDFKKWDTFEKVMRYSAYAKKGVIELMPIWNEKFYGYKYVNGHPQNTKKGKQTVIALGYLSDITTGYPLLVADMTLLTAIRTASVSALATSLMAKKHVKVLAFIGTGSQSEFQAIAHLAVCHNCKIIRYYDTSKKAMEKFSRNMQQFLTLNNLNTELVACKNVDHAVKNADCITTATASFENAKLLYKHHLEPGMHINAIGGDAVGKTELDKALVQKTRVVVEYFDQSYKEGEIQQLSLKEARSRIVAELYELVQGTKQARQSEEEITLFDSVGFAIEDFSTLRMIQNLSHKYNIGTDLEIIPTSDEIVSNLFSLLPK